MTKNENFFNKWPLFCSKIGMQGFFGIVMHVGLKKKRVEINNRGALNKENCDTKNFQKLINVEPCLLGM